MQNQTQSRILLGAALLLLMLSCCFPYWQVALSGPGLPTGLQFSAYVGHLDGTAGSAPAGDLAPAGPRIEASSRLAAGLAGALLVLALVFAARPFACLLRLPAILLPAVVVADAAPWLEAAARAEGLGRGASHPLLASHPGSGGLLAGTAALLLAASFFIPASRPFAKKGGRSPQPRPAGERCPAAATRDIAGLLAHAWCPAGSAV